MLYPIELGVQNHFAGAEQRILRPIQSLHGWKHCPSRVETTLGDGLILANLRLFGSPNWPASSSPAKQPTYPSLLRCFRVMPGDCVAAEIQNHQPER